jgi:nucleoside-diphosphate-sugar epimerase
MSKILITGVDGFTGRFDDYAGSAGHEVVGISHRAITT